VLRAITIYQPWAAFLVAGLKRYETRSWSTGHRGEIAIHASKRAPTPEELADVYEALTRLNRRSDAERLLSRGAVVGVATLTECTPTIWTKIDDDEARLGDFSGDRFAWRMSGPVPLDEPVPCRGRQRIWTLDEETERAVRDRSYPF